MSSTLPPTPPRAYRIERFVGRGGFGHVYLAQPLSEGTLGRVALKVMEEGAAEEWVARFFHEAQILSSLSGYPNFVHVNAVFRMERRFCIDMEYVAGLTLDNLLTRTGALPPPVACQIVRQVALALDAAANRARDEHGALLRVLHRDMKPGNLRLGAGGVVKILDFGLARSELRGVRPETLKVLPATLAYMAPERVGFRADFGAPADIYALGLVLYEMLAGKPFFHDPSVSSLLLGEHELLARLTAELIDELPEAVSPELRALLLRMLAIAPDERATAAETERACRELLGVHGDDAYRDWVEATLAPLEREASPGAIDPWGWVGTVRRSDADSQPAPAAGGPSETETYPLDERAQTWRVTPAEVKPTPGRRVPLGVQALFGALVVTVAVLLLRGKALSWYADADGDGYGSGAAERSRDELRPGFARQDGDCDEARADVFPTATETCDGADQDCDGEVDEGLVSRTWYRDADGDGLGAEAVESCALEAPEGMVAEGGDCDDSDAQRAKDCRRAAVVKDPPPTELPQVEQAPPPAQGQVSMTGTEATRVQLRGPTTLTLSPGSTRAVPPGTYSAVVEFEGGDYTVSVQVVEGKTTQFDCTVRKMGSPCQVR